MVQITIINNDDFWAADRRYLHIHLFRFINSHITCMSLDCGSKHAQTKGEQTCPQQK